MVLLFNVYRLLRSNLVLQIRYLLFRFRYKYRTLQQSAVRLAVDALRLSYRLLSHQLLQCFDLLQQLVQENQRLRRERLVQYLVI